MSKQKPKIVETLKPSSRADLEAQRHGVVCRGPSGAVYRVRKINLERHALSGGLPQKLRQLALEGTRGLARMFGSEDGQISDEGAEVRGYLDGLVLATIVDPKFTVEDLGTGELDDDPLLPARDYKWALAIAMDEQNRDGEGRVIFGREQLDTLTLYRHFHECPDDCQACHGVLTVLSASG